MASRKAEVGKKKANRNPEHRKVLTKYSYVSCYGGK